MKKVIIGILIGIAICVICAIIYVKCFMFVPDKDGMIYEDSVEFKCMTVRGWQEKISQYDNCDPKDIYCYYESSEFIAIVYDENYEEVAHYRFDDETGYDTKGEKEPKDYWTDKRVKKLKEKLNKMVKEVASNTCSDCNK